MAGAARLMSWWICGPEVGRGTKGTVRVDPACALPIDDVRTRLAAARKSKRMAART